MLQDGSLRPFTGSVHSFQATGLPRSGVSKTSPSMLDFAAGLNAAPPLFLAARYISPAGTDVVALNARGQPYPPSTVDAVTLFGDAVDRDGIKREEKLKAGKMKTFPVSAVCSCRVPVSIDHSLRSRGSKHVHHGFSYSTLLTRLLGGGAKTFLQVLQTVPE